MTYEEALQFSKDGDTVYRRPKGAAALFYGRIYLTPDETAHEIFGKEKVSHRLSEDDLKSTDWEIVK